MKRSMKRSTLLFALYLGLLVLFGLPLSSLAADEPSDPASAGAEAAASTAAAPAAASPEAPAAASAPVLADADSRIDPNLEMIIRETLGKPVGKLERQDLESITRLVAYGRHLQSLKGIELCPNLVFLDLGWNEIEDLTPLAGLKHMQRLYLDANKIKDISPLAQLKLLTILKLSSNSIKDFSPIAGLPFVHADISHNNALFDMTKSGIDFAAKVASEKATSTAGKQSSTSAQSSQVQTLEGIPFARSNGELLAAYLRSGVSMEYQAGNRVYRDKVQVEQVFKDPILAKKMAEMVGESYPQAKLAKIRELNLRGLEISSIEGLEVLEGLEYLDLGDNKIEDIQPLFYLSHLKALNLDHNAISDIRAIQNLSELRILGIDHNRVANLIPLLSMSSLQKVGISDNSLLIDFVGEQSDPLGKSNAEVIRVLEQKGVFLLADFLAPFTRGNYVQHASSDASALAQAPTGVQTPDTAATNPAKGTATGTTTVAGSPAEGSASEAMESTASGSAVSSAASKAGTSGAAHDGPQLWTESFIPDRILERRIREELNIGNAQMRKEDLARLKALDLYQRGVESLEGLQYAINLEVLDAPGNNIKDLSPLARLNSLRSVFLDENAIERVEPLAGLVELKDLHLSRNRLQDISPLLGLLRLSTLGLGENGLVFDFRTNIKSTPAVENSKTIRTFEERGVRIEGFNGNAYIEGNMIKFASADMITEGIVFDDPILRHAIEVQLLLDKGVPITPKMMEAITRLDLSGLGIESLKGLEFASELEFLNIRANDIKDLEPIRSLKKLRTLILDQNSSIMDTSPLEELEALQKLSLKGLHTNFTKEVAALAYLEQLDLGDTQITDLSFLSGLSQLTKLNAAKNQITSVEALVALGQLQELSLAENEITDASSLFGMNKLIVLDLSKNPLSFAEGVPLGSTSMKQLFMQHAGLSSLSWIGSFPELEGLYLDGNQIATLSDTLFQPKLRDLSIAYNGMDLDSSRNRDMLALLIRQIDATPYKAGEGFRFVEGNRATMPIEMPYVLFKDPALERRVIESSGATSRMDLQRGLLGNMRRLDATGLGITSLDGIKNLDGIEYLNLSQNKIEDIAEVGELRNLLSLDLSYNLISDVRPLTRLFNLRKLIINNNKILVDFNPDPKNYSAIAKTNGEYLAPLLVRGVQTISASGMDYRQGNEVHGEPEQVSIEVRREIEAEAQQALAQSSGAGAPRIKKIVVKKLPAAGVAGTPGGAGGASAKATPEEMRRAWGALAPIEDLALRRAVKEAMDAQGVSIPSALRVLYAYGLGIESLSGIELLVGLEVLDLGANHLRDISSLSHLISLKHLNLDGNSIADASPLSRLAQLRILMLSDNKLQDLEALAPLHSLYILGLANNNLDISFDNRGKYSARQNGKILYDLWTRGVILRHNYENSFETGNTVRGSIDGK